jgi:organic radical activating enzyme
MKWAASTLYLNTGKTASCHRASVSEISVENFDNFHNTPEKLKAREKMLQGEWPGGGCEYCRDIEHANGTSDRQFQLQVPEIYPSELDNDPTLTTVDPAILEIFFSNICNFKCVYCSPELSSSIQAEQEKFGPIYQYKSGTHFIENNQYKNYINKFWSWFSKYGAKLKRLQILGGESLLQRDFYTLIDFLLKNPNPELELTIITNLHVPEDRLLDVIQLFTNLLQQNCVKRIDIQASVDCWGPQQEYVRHGFNCSTFESNLKKLIDPNIFRVSLLSTVCSLTIQELPELAKKFKEWNSYQEIFWYLHLVLPNNTSPFSPLIFDYSVFDKALTDTLNLLPSSTWDDNQLRNTLLGIASKIKEMSAVDTVKQLELLQILEEIDRRRSTDWKKTFPWLINEIKKNHVV